MKDNVLFITGVSGSGKSTILHRLRHQLPDDRYSVHDLDENGVPENADFAWRRGMVALRGVEHLV